MENVKSLPLYERISINNTLQRVMDPVILLLLVLLVGYRASTFNNYTFTCWLLAFLCESWFTFQWVVILITKWSPAEPKTYLERLFNRVPEAELPPLDLFVTTADPVLEPPIITVNTVLSLMAFEYPAHKLACYVSDDGCSFLNFYALVEASKFAKLWVPFCKNYKVQVTAPFRYFSAKPPSNCEDFTQFKQEWFKVKEEYELLIRKIEDAARKSIPCQLDGEFAAFSNSERTNHPTIIKVIWENKEGVSDELPHLIYISREKRPEHPHHYKAGAMNVLTRVSGLMTNAPFMLNVDCDMIVNNPKIVLHAMCIFLDAKGQKEVAFIQCPQLFYDGLKDDPFGNQLVALSKYILGGMAGLQGPFYAGTNCFHRRKAIYGLSPDIIENGEKRKLSEKELVQNFGSSREIVKSAADALEGKTYSANYRNPSDFLEAAIQVSACGYEFGTAWGRQVGWLYGTTSEDVLTGLEIHNKGWRSERCFPDPIGFAGCVPGDFPSAMTQQKRWAAGLLKIFFSKHCPILCTLFGKVQFRECFAYLWLIQWAQRSVFELCYAALSAHCLITNTNFLPQEGHGLWIPVALFVIYNAYTLAEYFTIGLTLREWWNNQRMDRIKTMCAWFVGFLSCMFKVFGISEAVFEITQKGTPTSGGHHHSDNANAVKFTFNESPIFVVGTTILMVQMTALVIYFLRLQPSTQSRYGCGLSEVFCSIYLVVCFWPFFKGLFDKGRYGIPLSTICKSAVLAFLFVNLSISTMKV